MKLLLDTCAFLWIAQGSDRLTPTVRETFSSPDNTVFLSAVSVWEIFVKYNLGKLTLPRPPKEFVPRERRRHLISRLPLSENDIFPLPNLPNIHQDPFDRMLICQAIEHGLTILTPDEAIQNYPVKNLW